MMELSQYVLEGLRRDEEFVLYRGKLPHQSCSPSVLLLAPASMGPALETLRKIEHEYSLRDELDSAWAVRSIALCEQRGQTTLVLEDPGGEPLDRFLSGPMQMPQFLRLAVSLAAALGGLHKRELIHKDVKPANVLVDPATCQVRLMGFGIASRLSRERQAPEPPEFIAGTLPYMAPEQTGRMNRSIDSRSDLYALGVTLYEILTGNLPFTASDPMELVHCHIARQPTPPYVKLKYIPEPVSAIIMKLLAKTAEERYQTAVGVESDLRRCLAEWETQHDIIEFPLGEQDMPDRLVIPEKLYGRAFEIETLLAAFDRIVAGGRPELVLVSGYSGIGKSSVVNELHKPLVPPRGLFASGKFDQYKRDIPYATLAQAFQSLIQRLLGKREAELAPWQEVLREALGPNGQLMIDLVPELELIIGAQPPVPDLPPQDARRRFQLVFRRFISVFAQPSHPLALFLDDLQWLDAATLDLVEDLLTQSDVRHLMLIGAYRDNEVDSSHPLMRKLEAARSAGAVVHEIKLTPLDQEYVTQLIVDALHADPKRAAPLAQLVHEKTAGNPFFVIQFLRVLVEENLLVFARDAAQWSWNLDRIHAKGYADNVVDLMAGRLVRLHASTQTAVQQLACLGNAAEVATLSLVYGTTETEIHSVLEEALRAELIERRETSYRFIHDRIQEAAYLLVPESLRPEAHLRIGRLLAAHTLPEKRAEAIFEIVNQLNRGAALITSWDEREQLAEFNLIAAKRAKAATAYTAALTYLAIGGTALPGDAWERCYRLMFAIEINRAECEFLTGDLAAAEERLSRLSRDAANLVDKGAAACLRTAVYTTLYRSGRAVEICLEYLREAGIDWSPHPTDEEIREEYDGLRSQLGSRSIEALFDLPLMSDPDSRATMEVLTELVAPAYFTDANLWCLALLRMANLSIKDGNCDGSCYAYGFINMVIGARFGEYRTGFRFGQLCLDLVEKKGLDRFKARAFYAFGVVVTPWTRHVREGVPQLRRSLETALETGDQTYRAYGFSSLVSNFLASGAPLEDVQREAEFGLEFAQKVHFGLVVDVLIGQLSFIRTLRGLTPTFGSFCEDGFDERPFEQHLEGLLWPNSWYWIRKLQARFYAGDYSEAVAAAAKAHLLLYTMAAFFEEAEYHFYAALARAAAADFATPAGRREHFEALAEHQKRLLQWAENCPDNFENRAALVDAEIARLEGRPLDAERLYEQAIRSAHANGFINNEALANELAARFYAARGFDKIANIYLQDARYGYLRWGAEGKVRQLDQQYPQLRQLKPGASSTGTIAAPVEHLDLATVIKVSQAVSGELVLEKLIDRLMRAAIEHAGAERGLLIVPRGDELKTEAESTIGEEDVTVHLRDGAHTPAALPESLVRYVIRTQEPVMLEDASAQTPFSADPYIIQRRARSILSLPLINQGKLIGILYLENNLTPHVFTPDRVTVLKVLASQAAISLENSQLYRDLEDREGKIREQEMEFRQILDLAPQHVALVGGAGRERLYANRILLDYLGLTLEEWRQRLDRSEFVHPDDWERVDGHFDRALSSGAGFELEMRLRKGDGSYRWFLARCNHVLDEHRQIMRWYVAFTDIEDRKRAEQKLQQENVALREEIDKASMFEEIVGTSRSLKAVLSRIAKVGPTDSTVLITGETGTGKELIARAVHKRSHRSGRPFISVNCAALPPTLVSSELFGHEKGAFTGATQRRLGRFEMAERGTIFLDEVGELLPDTQAALLRVLQEREFERVGGGQPVRVDVRVIAATNRDLNASVANGTFRQDLLYRLNVFPIEVPPLRERKDDILMLVEYFVQRYANRAGRNIQSIDQKTLDLLQSYDWPGNIRELQNVIERSIILSSADVFSVDELWLSKSTLPQASRVETPSALNVEARSEREIIEAALAESRGRISGPSGAAAKLRIPRSTLDDRIKALKINKQQFKFG